MEKSPNPIQPAAPQAFPFRIWLFLVINLLFDRDQAYYWSSRWQAGEKTAGRDIREDRVSEFNTIEDLLGDLDRVY